MYGFANSFPDNIFILLLTKTVTNFIIYMFMLAFSNPFL